MRLSLVIPVFNEEAHLNALHERLRQVPFRCPVEFIFIDDCSRDNSWSVIQEICAKDATASSFRQPINQGKGAAIHKGIELATGEIFAIQDADLELNPDDLVRLLEPILKGEADVVYGSRFKFFEREVHRTFHYLVNRFLTGLSNMVSGIYLTDMETCYKVIKTEIVKNLTLESKRFGFEPEITARLAKLTIRIQELPIYYAPRQYHEGKKISWLDGCAAIWHILKFNAKPLAASDKQRLHPKYLGASQGCWRRSRAHVNPSP